MSVNPKELQAAADGKPPVHLLEHVADIEIAKALADGARKYGRRNYRLGAMNATVYGGAIRRHIGAWLAGEDVAPDSGISHLAHIGACIHVLFGSMDAGNFVDDRTPEEPDFRGA